jgi:hypothetical protein
MAYLCFVRRNNRICRREHSELYLSRTFFSTSLCRFTTRSSVCGCLPLLFTSYVWCSASPCRFRSHWHSRSASSVSSYSCGAALGLFLFWRGARVVFVLLLVLFAAIAPLKPFYIISGWFEMFMHLRLLFHGFIICLVYFGPPREYFAARPA